jgi:hypothetical protein
MLELGEYDITVAAGTRLIQYAKRNKRDLTEYFCCPLPSERVVCEPTRLTSSPEVEIKHRLHHQPFQRGRRVPFL